MSKREIVEYLNNNSQEMEDTMNELIDEYLIYH
jgi:hypothetical protein